MGLYWPNVSLVSLIYLFLYAGVYCILRMKAELAISLLVQVCLNLGHTMQSLPHKARPLFVGLMLDIFYDKKHMRRGLDFSVYSREHNYVTVGAYSYMRIEPPWRALMFTHCSIA